MFLVVVISTMKANVFHRNWLVNICSVLKLVKWTLVFQTKEVVVALTPPSSHVNFSKTQPSFPILILEKDFHRQTLEMVFCFNISVKIVLTCFECISHISQWLFLEKCFQVFSTYREKLQYNLWLWFLKRVTWNELICNEQYPRLPLINVSGTLDSYKIEGER